MELASGSGPAPPPEMVTLFDALDSSDSEPPEEDQEPEYIPT